MHLTSYLFTWTILSPQIFQIINYPTMAKGKSPPSSSAKGPRTRASNGLSTPKPKIFTFSLNHFHPRTKLFSETRKTLSVKAISKKKSSKSTYDVQLTAALSTPPATRYSASKTTPASVSTIDSDYLLNYPAPWKWNGTHPQTQETIEEETNENDSLSNKDN